MKRTSRSGQGPVPMFGVMWCAILLVACPRSPTEGNPLDEENPLDEGNPPDAGSPPDAGVPGCASTDDSCIALEDWCEASAKADCQRRVRCGFLEESKVQECVQRLLNVCPQTQYEHGVRTGRLAYSATRARECVAGYSGTACLETPPACEGVFEGKSKPGGTCGHARECAAGSFCRLDTCPGTCVAYRRAGETCDSLNPCEPRATCSKGKPGEPNFCRLEIGEGEACVCAMHRGDPRCGCQFDLICNAPPMTMRGTCKKRVVGLGEFCGYVDSGCTADAYCSGGYGSGTCQPARYKGESCSADWQCVGGDDSRRQDRLRCLNGTCVEAGNEGDDCSRGCKQELFCENARCRAFPGEGQPCARVSPHCDAQSVCDATSGLCVRLPEAGPACLP